MGIYGHIHTTRHGEDDYETIVRWTPPPTEDAEASVAAFTKRFAEELRNNIP
jgi:hypothetical protein